LALLNYDLQLEKEEGASLPFGDELDSEVESNLDSISADEEGLAPLRSLSSSSVNSTSGSNLELDASETEGSEETPARKLLILFEEKLPEIVTKQKADDFCVSFCYSNSKGARKKLVQNMVKIPRSRAELIPNFARVIASLNRIFGDIGSPIVDSLFKDFYGMYKAKSQQHLESKVKNIRYIGEMIKFKVAAPIIAFKVFKLLLCDLSNHNIELLGVLIETCGRYLYLLPHTHDKMDEVIETMVRLRKSKHMDLRQQTILDAAYFTVRPPEPRARTAKAPLTTVQKYIHFLIKTKLDKDSVGNLSLFAYSCVCCD